MKQLKSLILSFTIFAVSGFAGAEVINAHPGVGPVIAFGDSLTSGFNNQIPYPKFLEERLHQTIVMDAVVGMSTKDAIAKLPTLALDPAPKMVVFTIGGNDFFEIPPAQSFENLKQIIQAIQKLGALAVYAGINPPVYEMYPELRNMPPEELAKFNIDPELCPKLTAIARQMGAVALDDIMKDLWLDPNMMSDKFHPNSKGNEIVAQRLYDVIKEYYP